MRLRILQCRLKTFIWTLPWVLQKDSGIPSFLVYVHLCHAGILSWHVSFPSKQHIWPSWSCSQMSPGAPTDGCQPCVRLHHQILKHLSVIPVSLPTAMPTGFYLIPLKNYYMWLMNHNNEYMLLKNMNVNHQHNNSELSIRAYSANITIINQDLPLSQLNQARGVYDT